MRNLRGARWRRPRWCHQGHDRKGQPTRFRVVAMAAPTEREKTQMYVQRYLPHRRGRTGHGLLHGGSGQGFLEHSPSVEKSMVESGIVLLKYWLEVSPEEQTNRLTARIDEKRKIWKLSQMDLDSYARWDDRATTCLRRPTPRGRPGLSLDPTTRGKRDSISSLTCSQGFPTRKCPERMSSCRNETLLAASRLVLL
jgi:hypothetical protein